MNLQVPFLIPSSFSRTEDESLKFKMNWLKTSISTPTELTWTRLMPLNWSVPKKPYLQRTFRVLLQRLLNAGPQLPTDHRAKFQNASRRSLRMSARPTVRSRVRIQSPKLDSRWKCGEETQACSRSASRPESQGS